MSEPDIQESVALYEEGLTAFQEQRDDDALRLADQLEDRRYSGAFEVRALVLDRQGDTEAAVECLEEGVGHAPQTWLLWQLLGNFRSDLERYGDAQAAYEAALACPEVDTDSVKLNQAVLLRRLEEHEQALAILETIEDPQFRLKVASVRLGSLFDLERYEEVAALGKAALESDVGGEEPDPRSTAHILGAVALAGRATGEDPETTRSLALEGIEYDPYSGHALWVLREVEQACSEDARLWRVGMDGRDARMDGIGFYVLHTVVADTAYEAFEYAREIEETNGFDVLEFDEAEEGEARPDLPKGVYNRGLRYTYEREE